MRRLLERTLLNWKGTKPRIMAQKIRTKMLAPRCRVRLGKLMRAKVNGFNGLIVKALRFITTLLILIHVHKDLGSCAD